MCGRDLFDEDRLSAGDVRDRLSWDGIGKEADEITRMTGLECDADFAVGLEAANSGPVPGAWINDDKRPQLGIDFDSGGRDDAHKHIVDRPLQRASVDHKLGFVVENVRRSFRHVFAILVSALTHDVPEQDAALESVDCVFHRRREWAERGPVQLATEGLFVLMSLLNSFSFA